MPEIPQFVAQQEITPSNVAETAALQRGRRAGTLGNEQASDIRRGAQDLDTGLTTLGHMVDKQAQQHEIVTGFGSLTELATGLDDSLRQHMKNADPLDPNAAKTWREEVMTPALREFTSGFNTPGGKEWVASHAAELATQFHRVSVADESNRQGAIAVNTFQQASNRLTNMAAGGSGIDLPLSLVGGSIKTALGQVPGLSPQDQQKYAVSHETKLGHDIVKAGIEHAVDVDPQGGFEKVWKPEYEKYISGVEKVELQNRAIQREHTRLSTQNLQENMQDRSAKIDFNQNLSNIYNESAKLTPNGILLAPDFLTRMHDLIDKHPGAKFEPNTLKSGMDWAKAIQEEHNTGKLDTTDPALLAQMNSRLLSTDNPLTLPELQRMKIAHTISDHDAMTYRRYVEDQEKIGIENPEVKAMVSQSLQAARDYINPKGILGAALDLTGQQGLKVANWERWAVPAYLSLVRGGMKPQDALTQITAQAKLDEYKAANNPVGGVQQALPPPANRPPLDKIWQSPPVR